MTGSRQHEDKALEFIRSFQLEHRCAPNLRELAKGIGMKSPAGAHRIVQALAARGAIRYRPRSRRSIELVPASPVLSIELPPHLFAQVQALAHKAKVTPEQIAIEAIRDGISALRSNGVHKTVSRETRSEARA